MNAESGSPNVAAWLRMASVQDIPLVVTEPVVVMPLQVTCEPVQSGVAVAALMLIVSCEVPGVEGTFTVPVTVTGSPLSSTMKGTGVGEVIAKFV